MARAARDKHGHSYMFRKILSKLTASFKSAPKRTEPKPAHPAKSARPTGRDSQPRHERKRTHAEPARPAHAPRPAPVAPRAHAPAHAHAHAHAHAPAKPLPEVPKMDTTFTALGLGDRVAYAVQQKGYEIPTPIQAQAIPVVLAGKDVIGSAQTGTGKTAAFSLPILQRLGTHGPIRCLVLEPTRELALQVEESFKEYSKYTDLRTTVIYGGVGYGKQREDLAHGMDILVATPGRLLDFMEQGEIKLDQIQTLDGQPVAGQTVRRTPVARPGAAEVCRAGAPEKDSACIDVFPGDIGSREQRVESRVYRKGSGNLGTDGIRDQ